MSKGIDYGRLMHKAMRQLMVDVLSQVARDGLPGKHHLFISFDTQHPGVDMARSLRELYPGEMTIVLQDWFEDLAVMKDRFSVTLNFSDVRESLVIPFMAVKVFADPSVELGWRFEGHDAEAEEERDPPAPTPIKPAPAEGEVVSLDQFRKH